MDDENEITAKQRAKRCFSYHWRGMVLVMAPIVFFPVLFATPVKAMRCAYTLLVMAAYWITEAIPIYVTSLIPLIAMPAFGIMSSDETCLQYMKDLVLFFIVSMIVAMGVEYTNLHTRIALGVISKVGCSPRRLHFGIMAVATLISAFVSNSATTAMLCPIAKAILEQLDEQGIVKYNKDKVPSNADEPPYPTNVTIAFYLGIAYSASIGGCATLVGSGTNFAIKGLYDERFPQSGELTFSNFIYYNVPPVIVMFVLSYFWLEILLMGLFRPKSEASKEIDVGPEGVKTAIALVAQKRLDLGRIRMMEIFAAIYFVLMILLLFVNKPGFFTGYGNIMNEKKIKNTPSAIFVAFMMFGTPTTLAFCHYFCCRKPKDDKPAESLMTWQYFQSNFSWGIFLLLGGGFALSRGMVKSELAIHIGKNLNLLTTLPHPVIQLCSIVAGTVLTAFSANVAVANILLPVLFEVAVFAKMHPLYIALPAGLACGLAFHLPVSTPPNAIVAGFANIRTKDMVIAGIGPSLISIITYFAFSQFWGPIVFADINTSPEWVKPIEKASFTDYNL